MIRNNSNPDLPEQLYLETTNRCNSKCNICVRTFHETEPPKDLSLEEFHTIVDQFPSLKRVVLHGIGEPLLNEDLPLMIRSLKEKGVYVLFNSNATLLTKILAKKLMESGLDELRVSLDASTPETYLRMRGIPLFEQAIKNVKELISLKKELGRPNPSVPFWFVGSRENILELPGLIELASHIGVDEVYLQRLTYRDSDVEESVAREEQAIYGTFDEDVLQVIRGCHDLARELDIQFTSSGATTPLLSVAGGEKGSSPWVQCRRPWDLTYVTANGNVLPCCIAPFATAEYGDLVLGNILQTPFKDLWNHPGYTKLRERLKSPDPPGYCRGCGSKWSL